MKCEICDEREAYHLGHYEDHLKPPREVNICRACHSRIHSKGQEASIREQYFARRIKVPRSSLPFFQQLYPKIVDHDGEVLFDAEEIFNARYEVINDGEWEPALTFKELLEEIKRAST